MLEKIWRYGFVDVSPLNFETAAYIARYVLKKVNGPLAAEFYQYVDIETGETYWIEPEYITMSRKPGIGRDWFERFESDCFPSDEVPVPGVGVLKKVPRYYEEIFKHKDAVTMEEIKEMRRLFREENAEEYSPGRLMAKYKVKKKQVEQLKRS